LQEVFILVGSAPSGGFCQSLTMLMELELSTAMLMVMPIQIEQQRSGMNRTNFLWPAVINPYLCLTL
jgi:hypothetical protein